MENATRRRLAQIAKEKARLPFHGYIKGQASNLEPIVQRFPTWNIRDADGLWCAAFVYHCCVEAGFVIPYRPKECVSCHLAGCAGWEEYAMGDERIEYHKNGDGFLPEAGDIVLYDNVFINQAHDHMGILLEVKQAAIIAAEGNIPHDNTSGIIRRPMDEHIRAYIRIPNGYQY